MTDQIEYPTCEKYAAVEKERIAIQNFLLWCGEQGLELRNWNNAWHDGECPGPDPRTFEQLLLEYFEIDPALLEAERQQIFNSIGGE